MADLAVEPTSVEGPIKATKARVLRAPFGDGYSQRAANGINYLDESWEVEWENLDSTEESSLITQLEGAYGVTAIDWIPPDNTVSQKFTIEQWQKTHIIGNVGKAVRLHATLKREYDL